MGLWEWIILILTILFFIFCLYGVKILLNPKHNNYIVVRRIIPIIILVVIVVYGIASIIRYYAYMTSADATLMGLFNHDTTYTTIVNFVTLLAFYQVLVDRVEKLVEKNEIKKLEEGVPISTVKVITYSEHKKLVKKAEESVPPQAYRKK